MRNKSVELIQNTQDAKVNGHGTREERGLVAMIDSSKLKWKFISAQSTKDDMKGKALCCGLKLHKPLVIN